MAPKAVAKTVMKKDVVKTQAKKNAVMKKTPSKSAVKKSVEATVDGGDSVKDKEQVDVKSGGGVPDSKVAVEKIDGKNVTNESVSISETLPFKSNQENPVEVMELIKSILGLREYEDMMKTGQLDVNKLKGGVCDDAATIEDGVDAKLLGCTVTGKSMGEGVDKRYVPGDKGLCTDIGSRKTRQKLSNQTMQMLTSILGAGENKDMSSDKPVPDSSSDNDSESTSGSAKDVGTGNQSESNPPSSSIYPIGADKSSDQDVCNTSVGSNDVGGHITDTQIGDLFRSVRRGYYLSARDREDVMARFMGLMGRRLEASVGGFEDIVKGLKDDIFKVLSGIEARWMRQFVSLDEKVTKMLQFEQILHADDGEKKSGVETNVGDRNGNKNGCESEESEIVITGSGEENADMDVIATANDIANTSAPVVAPEHGLQSQNKSIGSDSEASSKMLKFLNTVGSGDVRETDVGDGAKYVETGGDHGSGNAIVKTPAGVLDPSFVSNLLMACSEAEMGLLGGSEMKMKRDKKLKKTKKNKKERKSKA